MHDLKPATDDESAAKQALDLFWRGIGGDIKIFGSESEYQIAHSATDNECLESRALQGLRDTHCVG